MASIPGNGRFVRLAETDRTPLAFTLDGIACTGLEGDTVLVACLQNHSWLRTSEFGNTRRSGFCLMGACQDCWMWLEDGDRIRACSTPLTEGLALLTHEPGAPWGLLADSVARLQASEDET